MKKRFVAQKLIRRLNEKIRRHIDMSETMILSVVLKGLPIAYSLAKMNSVLDNFVPVVAQRHMYMQYRVESYFPSLEWKDYFNQQLTRCRSLLIVDDVVNTGFTKQRVESVAHLLDLKANCQRFAGLILNQRNLANTKFVHANDLFALKVNAKEVECDWGLITVPLRDFSIKEAHQRCEEYFQKFWLKEKRYVAIYY